MTKSFKNTLIQITHNGMGHGNEDLGLQLIANYLKLLLEEKDLPHFIALYNEGVKLICAPSPVIETIKDFEAKGVKLVACKTCLNHFQLSDKTMAGIAGTMADIIELQKQSDKVITL